MSITEHDLRESLDRLAAYVPDGIDAGRLAARIRRRTLLRRAGTTVAVAVLAATTPVALYVLPLGHEPAPARPVIAAGSGSWIPGYAAVAEQTRRYALDQDETEIVEFTFTLGTPGDRLKITTTAPVDWVAFCNLTVNGTEIGLQWEPPVGSRLGDCAPPVTRQVFLDQLAGYGDQSWDVPEHFRPQELVPGADLVIHDREWSDLGVRPGEPVTVTLEIGYLPVRPSAGPEHVTGDLTVGLYRPA